MSITLAALSWVGEAHAQADAPADPASPPAEAPTPAPEAAPKTIDANPTPSSSDALAAPLAPPAPLDLPPAAPLLPAPSAAPPPANAGFYDEVFYLRESTDNFRLYIQGRANIDGYAPFGPGLSKLAAGNALKSTIFLRRVRPEVAGEFLHQFQFKIEGDWGQSTSANTNGQTAGQNCSVDKTGVQTCTTRTSAVQSPTQSPSALDVFVNWAPAKIFNLQIGQFKVPFTLENRTSENFTPFMEASLPVRAIAVPVNRDIGAMAWGETDHREIYYSLGIFNGDGPNRPNPDNRFEGIGRVFSHPLSTLDTPLKDLQIGVSGRFGSRDSRFVGYDYTAPTTQGGFAFWKTTYTDSAGNFTHVIPSGAQRALGGEFYLPIDPVELMAELVYVNNNTREAVDGYQLSGFSERFGSLHGTSYYVQAGVWLLGDRGLLGRPGYSSPTHLDFSKPAPSVRQGLELLAKFEQVHLTYAGGAHSGGASPIDGHINVDAFSAGLNYWFTRHVRLSANYGFYDFPGSLPASPSPATGPKQTSSQRAIAPAQNLAKGVDDSARNGGHTLHEFMFRVGVAI